LRNQGDVEVLDSSLQNSKDEAGTQTPPPSADKKGSR
jgi:hypothetical protein